MFGGVDAEFNVAVRANGNSTFTVKAEIDNSLIDAYNEEHGTNYVQVPANIASQLQITDGTIGAGQLQTSPGVKVTDPNKAAEGITENCILPLKLTFVYPNGQTAELPNAYVIIKPSSSFINDNATEVVGTVGDGTGWSAINCTNLDPDAFSGLFSGSSWSRRWRLLDGNNPYCQFTVDLGEEKNLTGFSASSYAIGDYEVEVSTDNATWTSLGSTEGHTPVSGYDYSTWESYEEYVLYGAIKCRYVRFSINFNTSGWGWRYYKYLTGLSLYFN